MSRRAIPILPDSTGREISLKHQIEITYQSGVGTNAFKVGDSVIGQTSKATGLINRVISTSATNGIIYVTLDATDPDKSFVNGENLQVSASTKAVVESTKDIYTPKSTLVSYDNPFFGQKIDLMGAASVRYPDGPIQIDAYGRARVSNATLIGEYGDNNYTINPGVAYSSATLGSSVSFNSQNLAKVLSCSTGSNDAVQFASNYYHKYIPGQSQLIEGSVVLGEAGKDNVTYEWGYFDNSDGIFFRSENKNLGVVIRNSSSGAVVDNFISQSAWNFDTLDGENGIENPSGLSIDLTKIQQYWFDFQWPTGQIRFGIYEKGERLTVHKIQNFNQSSVPIIRTPSLPIRATISNNSSGSASTSTLSFFDGRVWTEGPFQPDEITYQATSGIKSVGNTPIPIMAFQPKDQIFGRDNRSIAVLSKINAFAKSGTNDEPIKVSIYGNTNPFILSGSSYTAFTNPFSGVEVDVDATSFVSGTFLGDSFFAGVENRDVTDVTEKNGIKNIGNNFDISSKRSFLVAASTIRSGSIADVEIAISWKEIQD